MAASSAVAGTVRHHLLLHFHHHEVADVASHRAAATSGLPLAVASAASCCSEALAEYRRHLENEAADPEGAASYYRHCLDDDYYRLPFLGDTIKV